MNTPALIFFGVLLVFCIFGGLTVLNMATTEHTAGLTYSLSIVANNTKVNTTGSPQYFYLVRVSETQTPHIDIVYEGGNASDQVYVNGNLIGNLTPPSPDAINFNAAYLALNNNVTYHFAAAVGKTNITQANITYLTYDGCNYDEDTCDVLQVNATNYGLLTEVLTFVIILIAAAAVILTIKNWMG